MKEDTIFTFDKTIRLIISVFVIVGLFMITRRLSSVLLPFIIAWFIAYMINPLVNVLQTKVKIKNRTLATILALIIVIVALATLIALLALPVKSQVARMGIIINTYMSGIDANTWISEDLQNIIRTWLSEIDYKELLQNFDFTSLAERSSSVIGSVLGTSINMIEGLFVVFIVILYLIFILLDFDELGNSFIGVIPSKYRNFVSGVLKDLSEGMSKYFRGQAIIASCVGILFAIGFSIMGLPMGIIVGLFIGLLNMVPYLQTLGIPICMVLGLMQSAETSTSYWIILLEIAAIFIVVQAIQDMFLTPKIMGNTLGMKPAVMLLALSIWGSLLGVAGMIIALPLTTVMISTYKHYVLENQSPTDTATVEPEKTEQQEPPTTDEK